jgi:hypothetical protein
MRGYCLARLFQHGHGDISSYARKVIQELIEGRSALEIVKQVLHGHTSTRENRNATLYSWINSDETLAHCVMIRRPGHATTNTTAA